MLKHVYSFPWTVLGAERAPDAAFKVHLNEAPQIKMLRSGHQFNAIYGTDYDAGFTTCASVLVDDRELLGLFLSWWLKRIHA
jgi:hypothetical protein